MSWKGGRWEGEEGEREGREREEGGAGGRTKVGVRELEGRKGVREVGWRGCRRE